MTDLERVELAARRTAHRFDGPTSDLSLLMSWFAQELLRVIMEKDPDGEERRLSYELDRLNDQNGR